MGLQIIIALFDDSAHQPTPAGNSGHPGGSAVGISSEEVRVVLHQDSWHEVPSVAGMLTEVIAALEGEAALAVATRAFAEGCATVITCAKPKALRYYKQLVLQYCLMVTLEAVG